MRFTGTSTSFRLLAVAAFVVLLSGCMKSPEEQYAGYMESGTEYAEAGDFTSATLQFRNAARVNPESAEPHFELAKAYLREGKLQECYQSVREAVALDPEHNDARLLMAQILARMGNEDEAREAQGMLEGVLAARPDDAEALFAMAVTRARLGSAEDAENFLQQVLSNSPDHLRSAVALARLRMNQGNLENAEEILRAAVAESEDPKPAQIALVQFLLSSGREDEATQTVEAILDADPDYGPALLSRGLLHLRAGEKDEAEAIYKRASEVPGEIYETAYARVLSVNGKLEAATAEFQRLYDADTTNRQKRTLLISAKLREGKVDDAQQLLTDAITANSRDLDARLQRAELYLRSNRTELARSDVNSVLEVQSVSPQAHYLLAKVHEVSQNPLGARQELGEALRLDSSFLLARLDMAQSLLRSASRRSALDILSEAPEAQQQNPRLISGRIWALIALGDYNDALNEIANVRSTIGELRDLHLQEGVIRAAQEDYPRAEALLSQALAANPTDLRAFNGLVAAQFGSKQVQRGLSTARQTADAHPQQGPLQLAAGSWFLRAGDQKTARSYLERASKIGGSTTQAEVLLANLDLADGDRASAMARLKSVTEKDSSNVEALGRLATAQEAEGQFSEAEKNYRAVLRIYPESVTVLNNLAYLVATHNGDLDEALTLAQAAREHATSNSPTTGLVEDTLGWVHYLRGSYDIAALNLESAVEKAPESAVIHYHLAMAQAKAGNTDEARAAYQAGLALDSDLPEAREVAALLP